LDILNTNDYLVWDTSWRTLVKLGPFELPFELSILGLVAGFLLFSYISNRMAESSSNQKGKNKNRKNKKQREQEIPLWKGLGILAGALVLGQVLFYILPAPFGIEKIGPIEIRMYGLMFATAFLLGYLIERGILLRAGRTEEEIERLLTYILIGTVVGARLGHVLFYDPVYYLTHPINIIQIWEGGLASHGAAIGILLAFYFYLKKTPGMSYLWVADRIVIVVALGGALVRIGNFFNSEIVGRAAEVPWAVIFTGIDQIPRHPTMLYESLLYLFLFAILWYIFKKYKEHPPEGYIFGVFLIILFGGRSLLEVTKVHQAAFAQDWSVTMGQLLSIPFIGTGIWLLWKKVDWKEAKAPENS